MKKYDVIYADPPWSYENTRTGGAMESGADAKYMTMTNRLIMEMPIEKICEENWNCLQDLDRVFPQIMNMMAGTFTGMRLIIQSVLKPTRKPEIEKRD